MRHRLAHRERRLVLVASTIFSVCLILPASAPATSADRAATFAYRSAEYELERAFVANTKSSKLALEALAAKLGGECPGVLKTLPRGDSIQPPNALRTPRARGEFERQIKQRSAIEYELDTTLLTALYQPDSGAEAVFDKAVAPLRWSDPRIAQVVQQAIAEGEAVLTPPPAAVCGDMRAWEQSGYRTLSATTKEFEQRQIALAAERGASNVVSLRGLLKRFEGPPERALLRRAKTLAVKILGLISATLPVIDRLHNTLGLTTESLDEKRERPTVIEKHKTHAGPRFEVTIPPRGSAHRRSCPLEVSVEFTTRSSTREHALVISTGTTATRCVGGPAPSHATVACRDGLLTIATSVLARTRRVRLLLSDSQTVTSRVAVIPARLGGPAAFYVQALRGASPTPISLTELDKRGRTLGVIGLTAPRSCKAKPTPKSEEERFEAPTFTTLTHGQTPDGTPFTVKGVTLPLPHHHAMFSIEVNAGIGQDFAEEEFTPGEPKKALSWSLAMECPPHEYAIVYGLLKAPGDSVLARTSTGLVPLTKVAIAPTLHAEGPLVYGAFSTVPSELVVRRADGSILYTESLAKKATDEAEFCEGYAEG